MKRALYIASLAVLLMACDKKEEAKTDDPAKNATTTSAASAAVTATASATATAAPEVAIKDEDIATPADFEEAAEKSIDAKNYKTELATLEKDIAKD